MLYTNRTRLLFGCFKVIGFLTHSFFLVVWVVKKYLQKVQQSDIVYNFQDKKGNVYTSLDCLEDKIRSV